MKICVLSASPKGEASVTYQYIRYLQKQFPTHQFTIHHIGQEINKLEKNQGLFEEVINDVRASDGILWAFPVYVFLVPSQYKRFIELIFSRNSAEAFKNKYTASFSTSIHFFDHTAHNYIQSICDDLEMNYTGFFSAEMEEGRHLQNRERIIFFAKDFITAIEEKRLCARVYPAITAKDFRYVPGNNPAKIPCNGKRVVILTDDTTDDSNLSRMIEYFRKCFTEDIPVYRLQDIDIRGGCLGCIQCGPDNICVYKDGFTEFFNSKLRPNDIIIFAGTVTDRYLSSKWKQFSDRAFFKGHTPSFPGAQQGFIISGPVSQIPNLREVLQASAEMGQANFSLISDESGVSGYIDELIQEFARSLVRYAEAGYVRSPTYLAIGGRKIFRDSVYGKLRFVFLADHVYYKKHGYYDFPQKDYWTRCLNAVMCALMKIPAFKSEFKKRSRKEPGKQVEKYFSGVN
jgi:multimeric flavodoxin WrbA